LPVFRTIKEAIEKVDIKPPKWNLINYGKPELYKKQEEEFFELIRTVRAKTLSTIPKLFALKHPAFSEEQEIRLVSYLVKVSDDKCQFHISNNEIVPHREYKLTTLKVQPINEVILGPKNETPEFVIEKLLALNGFQNVKVRRSIATYR